jgi:hypothetical protein
MLMLACLDRGSRKQTPDSGGEEPPIVSHVGFVRGVGEPSGRKLREPRRRQEWQGVDWRDRDGIPAIGDALVWSLLRAARRDRGGDHGSNRRVGGSGR